MNNKLDNRYYKEAKILLNMLWVGIFLMVLYAIIKLFSSSFNLVLIVPEVFFGVTLFFLLINFKNRLKDKVDGACLLIMKKQLLNTLILMAFIHFFVVMFHRALQLRYLHLYYDFLILLLFVMLGLLSRKEGLFFFQSFFEQKDKKWPIALILALTKLFGVLMIFLTFYAFFGYFVLADVSAVLYVFEILLKSFVLFSVHIAIYLTYEYLVFREDTHHLDTGIRCYTSRASLLFRLILLLLTCVMSFTFLYQAFIINNGSFLGLLVKDRPAAYFLGLWIASFQLLFYGVFFDGILKLKRPGNNNIKIIIYIILGQFVVHLIIPFYGLYALSFGTSSIITDVLNVVQLIFVILMFLVGLMVYDYFDKQQFPKAKYFLSSILLQPTVYLFNAVMSLGGDTYSIDQIVFFNQLYATTILIATSALSVYAIYHMAYTPKRCP